MKENATQKSRIKVIEFQQQQQCVSFRSDRIDARTCVCVGCSSMLPSLRARHIEIQPKRKQICLAKVILMIVHTIRPFSHSTVCVAHAVNIFTVNSSDNSKSYTVRPNGIFFVSPKSSAQKWQLISHTISDWTVSLFGLSVLFRSVIFKWIHGRSLNKIYIYIVEV